MLSFGSCRVQYRTEYATRSVKSFSGMDAGAALLSPPMTSPYSLERRDGTSASPSSALSRMQSSLCLRSLDAVPSCADARSKSPCSYRYTPIWWLMLARRKLLYCSRGAINDPDRRSDACLLSDAEREWFSITRARSQLKRSVCALTSIFPRENQQSAQRTPVTESSDLDDSRLAAKRRRSSAGVSPDVFTESSRSSSSSLSSAPDVM
mmetsp:Transcript_11613/g.25285  ORF Transcript_11613/g.25285 Transcript_11613/m.25285 type:complete len:208 (+) Transcript_11613:430-1053(+)